MNQGIVLAFLSVIVIVIISLSVREKYTPAVIEKIHQVFSQTGESRDNLRKYLIKVIINELENDMTNKLSNVNLLVDTLNTGRTNPWTHYASVNDFDTMLESAYTSGESGLSDRDRMVLRAIALPGIDMTIENILYPITYTSEDVPDFSTTIITESGKTSKEMLLFCFKIVDMLANSRESETLVPWTPETIDYINSYIPDSFGPKFNRNDPAEFEKTFGARSVDEIDAKSKWLWKAVTLGPAYIAKLAENRWRLDLDWKPPV
jgi:hypothetical protein